MFCVVKWEIHIKHFCRILKYDDCIEERHLCRSLHNELTAFFHGTSFILERLTDRQTMITQIWVFTGSFLKMSHSGHFKEND